MTQHIQDACIRQRALDVSHSFIVQAPAGSGKTEILTQRYLALLSHAQKAPEEIIAITFTRKSAAEMRARILHALEFGQEPEPDRNHYRHTTWTLAQAVLKRDHALAWQLLQNPNRLRILTIDALSAFLCRQTPMLTQFGGSPAVCENATTLYKQAATQLLTHIANDTRYHRDLDSLLLHLDNNVENLVILFSDLLNHRDQWLPHIMACYTHGDTLRVVLENSLKRVRKEKMQLAMDCLPQHAAQMIVMLARHAGEYFTKNNPKHPIAVCANFIIENKIDQSHFPLWFGLANLLLTKTGEWRKTVDIRVGFGPKEANKTAMLALLTELQEHENFKESLNDILIAPPAEYNAAQWETLTALTQLLPLLAAQLTCVFQEKGQVDFTELNFAALKALGSDESPTDLALYLDYQIRHLLIDEFQDTSVTHLHLLEKITAGWEQNDGRTLFLVGDPMQSIYRFRNAEVGLFLRAQQQGIGHIFLEPLTLTMNFRSQENLISWFNNTFSTIFPAIADITTGRVPYTKTIAAKNADHHHAQFYPIVSDRGEDEATLLIEKIKLIREKNKDESIAILVRSRAQLIPIIQLLNTNQLPFQAVDIEPLSKCPEIQDLLSLTRALLHRADYIAWLAILRAPFCGLLLADIEILIQSAEKKTIWEAILECDNTPLSSNALLRLKKLRQTLQHAFNKQYQLLSSQWIEGIWISLGGPICLKDATALNNTRAFFDLLLAMENESNVLSTAQLLLNCEKLFSKTQCTQNNAIQILTIHKSKGLEFDHVFLPGLHRQSASDQPKLLRWLDRPTAFGADDLILAPIKSITNQSDYIYDYLKEVEKQKQDHEITRLLYVAATRAKKSLHLFTLLQYNADSTLKPPVAGSFLHKLWPILESECTAIAPANTTQSNNHKAVTTIPLFSRLTTDWQSSCDTTTLIPQPVIKIDIALHSPLVRIIGTVIHEILQSLAEKNATSFSVSQYKSRLLFLGTLPHEIPSCLETIHAAIQKTQEDNRGQWILSRTHKDAHCELPLTHITNSEIQHAIIDRTFIDENNIRWIIDYKTAQPKENEALETFLEKQKTEHQAQLENYAAILAPMENNPIQLGLYFPLCAQWISWNYTT